MKAAVLLVGVMMAVTTAMAARGQRSSVDLNKAAKEYVTHTHTLSLGLSVGLSLMGVA
jgi:hypothetical protein